MNKARVIIFIALYGVLTWFTIGYSNDLNKVLIDLGVLEYEKQTAYIDGADVSFFVNGLAFLGKGFVAVGVAIIFFLINGLCALCGIGVLRLASIRKYSIVNIEEYNISKSITRIGFIIMLCYPLLRFGFKAMLLSVPLIIPPVLFTWLIYLLALRNRVSRQQAQAYNDNENTQEIPDINNKRSN